MVQNFVRFTISFPHPHTRSIIISYVAQRQRWSRNISPLLNLIGFLLVDLQNNEVNTVWNVATTRYDESDHLESLTTQPKDVQYICCALLYFEAVSDRWQEHPNYFDFQCIRFRYICSKVLTRMYPKWVENLIQSIARPWRYPLRSL